MNPTPAQQPTPVPFLDLPAQHRALKPEILAAWSEILDKAGFIGGRYLEAFEKDFAAACGAPHCVGVNSGTDALRFIFIALGLKPGDEVITVPDTFIATTEAISQAGGRPVFVDVDPKTYNMDPAKLAAAVTPRTRGIVPVHLFGQPADMDPILDFARAKGLWVVEDACQAHLAKYKGRRAGALAAAAAFSFYPGKNLGACGEGGAVVTSDPALAKKVAQLRDHGQAQKYHHDMEGYNGRLDALQAAALDIKLKHLPSWTERRQANARLYSKLLAGVAGVTVPHVPDWADPVWHLYVIQLDQRDQAAAFLKDRGVMTGLHYPKPLHLQEAYRHLGHKPGAFPVTEAFASRLLSLPMFPELTEEQIRRVVDALAAFLKQPAAR